MESWIKIRIEVAGRTSKLYLNGSTKPSLIVDGLKGEDLHGAVGLWGFTDEEAYFSNVRITATVPQNLKTGFDFVGSWEMRYSNDVSGMDASMELHRIGSQITGTWSGPLGEHLAVRGNWRNGYVELAFSGEWPADSRKGAPGPVNVVLSGWIDEDSGRGRMRIDGRSDGTWTATKKSSHAVASQR